MSQVRLKSVDLAARYGIGIPRTLPLLEPSYYVRSIEEVEARLLCMHAVLASSYRFERAKALTWICEEKLYDRLLPRERLFLDQGLGSVEIIQSQTEAMWALAWGLGIAPQLDFTKGCDDRFVFMLPDLRRNESSDRWRLRTKLRSDNELLTQCDLAYCLHWAIRQSSLNGDPPPAGFRGEVVVPRRQALEWLLSDDSWDQISLDT